MKNPIKMAIDHGGGGTVELLRNGKNAEIKAPFVIWSDGDPDTENPQNEWINNLTSIP